MENVKCECGHVNPYGTAICESCGKPLEDEKGLLDMRYEGAARRSQTYNRTIIDKIWNFFSSVKVGIWIIVITLVASSLGTILPQQFYLPPEGQIDPKTFYADEYGVFGSLYYSLGFHNLYSSWWYMLLIASLGVSLIICSIDRVVPLYRALKKQKVTRHESFLMKQRIFGRSKVENVDETIAKAKQLLKEKKYNIREENGNIVAEKGRFSRWGPYVNHVGIIIFLIGCMLRYFPGMYVDTHVWIREGETVVVPGTDGQYFVKNDKFIVELYDENDPKFGEMIKKSGSAIPKNYQTNAILYEMEEPTTVGEEGNLVEVGRHEIRVNEPMKFAGFALYQTDYKLNEFREMTFELIHKDTGENFGKFDVDLWNPKKYYDLGNGYKIKVHFYFADYFFNEKGEPASKSKIPNNPAFVFETITPEKPEDKGEISFLAVGQNLEPLGENEYKVNLADLKTTNVTALTVRKDYTLPVLFVGGAIFMIGLIQGSYWTHRRIWIQRVNGEVWISAHSNKNWTSLMNEIMYVVDKTDLQPPVDQVKEKENTPKEEQNDANIEQ